MPNIRLLKGSKLEVYEIVTITETCLQNCQDSELNIPRWKGYARKRGKISTAWRKYNTR